MSPSAGAVPDALKDKIESFLDRLSMGNLKEESGRGSVALATATVNLLKRIVLDSQWSSAQELMRMIRSQGKRMVEKSGTDDVIIGNLVRRVLKLVREDYHSSVDKAAADQSGAQGGDADANILSGSERSRHDSDFTRNAPDLRDKISQSIEELAMELETSADEISDQALEHIHASEVILTIGRSRTVEMFLKRAAAKGRTFQVIVAESAPYYSGHGLAVSLAKSKIQTTVINDSAIFAVMSRVNKVIVGTHSIMADGGLKGLSGIYTVALAAHQYSVPLIVTASMHKLTPQHFTTLNKEAFSCFVSPMDILKGDQGGGQGIGHGKMASKINASFPLFEYVPPDLVTLFISNISGCAPSYVYRLLSELYHPDDYEL